MHYDTNQKIPMQIIAEHFLRSKESKKYNLTTQEKLLLFFLSSYCGKKGICFPSYKKLMEDISCNKNTVSKSLLKLESLGLIKIERNHRKNNIYTINVSLLSTDEILKEYSKVQTRYSMSTNEIPSRVQMRYCNNINNNNINNKVILLKNDQKEKKKNPITEKQRENGIRKISEIVGKLRVHRST